MKRIARPVGPGGQITLPEEIQQRLLAGPQRYVIFEIDDDEIRLLADAFTLESAHASIPPLTESIDDQELERRIKEEQISVLLDEMADQ